MSQDIPLPASRQAPSIRLVVQFDTLMNLDTFSIADDVVSFQGPGGAIAVSSFQWLDDDSLQLNFDPQTKLWVSTN